MWRQARYPHRSASEHLVPHPEKSKLDGQAQKMPDNSGSPIFPIPQFCKFTFPLFLFHAVNLHPVLQAGVRSRSNRETRRWSRPMASVQTWRGQRAARDVASISLLLLPLRLFSQTLLALASKFAVGHWFEVEVSPAARVAFAPVEMSDKYCRLGTVALNIFHPGFRAWLPAARAGWARRLLRLKHLHLWLRTGTGTGEVDRGAKTRGVEGKGNLLSRGKDAKRLV